MRLRPILALSLALSGFASFAHGATVKGDLFACKTSATIEAAIKLRTKTDGKASEAFQTSKIASGECTAIPRNSTVGIDERKGPLLCVRPAGGLDCFWTTASGVDEFGRKQVESAPEGNSPPGGHRRRR